jgi:group II intron reverse transcriptase/maturase
MLSARLIKKLEGIEKCSKNGSKVRNLFQILTNNPELWMQAYANIYPNKGALTEGIDAITVDGFCEDRVLNSIKLLKEGRYAFKPSRRVFIRKANGKQRPLGVQSGDDKLLQEVVRILLERVYEPVFSEDSHGFRPGRSCHTALNDIRVSWTAVKWLINIDVKSYFDNIDHQVLVKLLERKIDDRRFIKLIKEMLRAGYMDRWKFNHTYSGTPQGSGCSPIMANLYLHELDQYMNGVKAGFDQGNKRRRNPEYSFLSCKIRVLRKRVDALDKTSEKALRIKEQIKQLDKQRKSIPSGDIRDPHYKRVYYSRYADDTLIGVIGSKAEAQEIMEKVRAFLRDQLNLPISEEKSEIKHAAEGMIFLGYEVRTYAAEKEVKMCCGGRHTKKRVINQKMDLYIPENKVKKFCQTKGYGNYDEIESRQRPELLHLSDYEIIGTYNAELRGLANYYCLAFDVKQKLNRLFYIGQKSLVKTLANKHRTKARNIILKLKQGKDYVYRYRVNGEEREIRLYTLKQMNSRPKMWQEANQLPNTHIFSERSEIIERMSARQCEYCGREDGYFEVHHIRKLSDIKEGKEKWQKRMIARRRKTLVLCVECHDLLHAGKLPSWRASIYERSGEPCAFKEASTVRRETHACTPEV